MTMNVILFVLDSLNRSYLTPYGAKDIQTPNFERLARRCVTMDNHWTGSLPTIPCRHEILTGRHGYLWRPWGPAEPYDVTVAQLCRDKGQVAQLITDTHHYFRAGACNYHTEFSGWDFLRGQVDDPWETEPVPEKFIPRVYREMIKHKGARGLQYMRNTRNRREDRDFFPARLYERAADWLDRNHTHKNFFLMVDSFTPHEPFHCPPPFDRLYDPDFEGEWTIWNNYDPADRFRPEVARHIRAQYMGMITMLDKWLGAALDRLDRYSLWDNSLVMLVSDHGHHLGEHGIFGKNSLPHYRHFTNIPLFVSFPGMKPKSGARSKLLTSQIDLYPTIAEALGAPVSKDYVIHGYSLLPALRGEATKIRDIAHSGYFGKGVMATDGRHALHKMPARADNQPLFRYGIALDQMFVRAADVHGRPDVETGRFLPYTTSIVYKVPSGQRVRLGSDPEGEPRILPDLLFDLNKGDDLGRDIAKKEPRIVARLTKKLAEEYERIGAPAEQFERLGLK